MWLSLWVLWIGLQGMTVLFSDHTHLHFMTDKYVVMSIIFNTVNYIILSVVW